MRKVWAAVLIAVVVPWLAACSRPTGSHLSRSAAPRTSRAPASAAPRRVAGTAPPAATPKPVTTTRSSHRSATASPAPAAARRTKVARGAVRGPNDPPQILDVAVSETTVHPGDTVSGSVVTTSNVASVEARIGGYAMTLNKVGIGRFVLTYTVAQLPWFVRGSFTMRVIARNTRGDAVERAVPLTVR